MCLRDADNGCAGQHVVLMGSDLGWEIDGVADEKELAYDRR